MGGRGSDRLLAFGFGVAFLTAILVIAIVQPNPTGFSYTVFRIVLALAAAGVGAVIPGFLQVSYRNLLRAGGAVALFVIVYFFAPAPLNTIIDGQPPPPPPTANARPIAEAWLKEVDQGAYGAAYGQMAKTFKARFEEADVVGLLQREHASLGPVVSRTLVSAMPGKDPPGSPEGHYQAYTYATRFTREPRTIYETVSLYGQDGEWKVAGFFTAVKNDSGQFIPYEPPTAALATPQASP